MCIYVYIRTQFSEWNIRRGVQGRILTLLINRSMGVFQDADVYISKVCIFWFEGWIWTQKVRPWHRLPVFTCSILAGSTSRSTNRTVGSQRPGSRCEPRSSPGQLVAYRMGDGSLTFCAYSRTQSATFWLFLFYWKNTLQKNNEKQWENNEK